MEEQTRLNQSAVSTVLKHAWEVRDTTDSPPPTVSLSSQVIALSQSLLRKGQDPTEG